MDQYTKLYKTFKMWTRKDTNLNETLLQEMQDFPLLYHRVPEEYVVTVLEKETLYPRNFKQNIERFMRNIIHMDGTAEENLDKRHGTVKSILQMAIHNKEYYALSCSTTPTVNFHMRSPLLAFNQRAFSEHYRFLPIDLQTADYGSGYHESEYSWGEDLEEITILSKTPEIRISPLNKYIKEVVISDPFYLSESSDVISKIEAICKQQGLGLVVIPKAQFIDVSRQQVAWDQYRVL